MRRTKPYESTRRALGFLMSLMLALQLLGSYAPAALAETLGEAPAAVAPQNENSYAAQSAQEAREEATRKEAAAEEAAAAAQASPEEVPDEENGDAQSGQSPGDEDEDGETPPAATMADEATSGNTRGSKSADGEVPGADDAVDDKGVDGDAPEGETSGSEDADAKKEGQEAYPAKEPEATPQADPVGQKQNYAIREGETFTFYWGVPPTEGDDLFLGGEYGDYPPTGNDEPFHSVQQKVSMVVFDESLIAEDGSSHLRPSSTENWFAWFSAWGFEGLDRIDMSHVTNMSNMFVNAESVGALHGIENWDVSNVESMCQTFCCCHASDFDLSKWDVSNVKDFANMFDGSQCHTIDLSGWNTKQAAKMYSMFYDCSNLKKVTLGKDFSFNGQAELNDPPTNDTYDGTWVYAQKAAGVGSEVPVGTKMGAEALGDAYDGATMAGTWEWGTAGHTVQFDPNGGNMDESQRIQWVKDGQTAKRPTGAKRRGFVFQDWFEDGVEKAYEFETPVTGDVTLVAKWQELDPVDYVDENGEPQTRAGDEYEPITADASGEVLQAGWYAVLGDVTLPERPKIDGVVHLILCDGATLTAEKGINVTPGNALWVYWQEGKTGALEATGPDYAAGIGGSLRESAGDFVLAGGTVTATGGHGAAGVGAGPARRENDTETAEVSAGGAVTVYAGELTATGGKHAAGIGGGDAMAFGLTTRGGTFKIYGGKVVAAGGYYGAGIGSGHAGGSSSFRDCYNYGGTFEAYGGVVEAQGSGNGAGIGCGSSYYATGDAGVVTISGDADVTARGGEYGAGIGVGQGCGNGAEVAISGGKVTAVGGTNGAGIGGGQVAGSGDYDHGSGGKVTISGGEVTATGGSGAAGIGGGFKGHGAEVSISGGEVTATGGYNGAGIGAGSNASASGSLDVSGGKVTAKAGYMAAGIGSGYGPFNGETTPITVTISGGELYAYGSCEGAAIGGGENNPGGDVTITGGKVVADGRYYSGGKESKGGAGIGSAAFGRSGGTVLIEGDAEVTAIGGQQGAGIGGSYYGSGADVTVRATDAGAPKVTATGGRLAPGIGRGDSADDPKYTSGSLTVEGKCSVTAIGGEQAAGIGGSAVGSGATVIVRDGATVTAQAGAPSDSGHVTQAIGCGDHETAESVNPGSLTIYPEAKVLRGDAEDGVGATPALAAERVDDCRAHLWAQISPCEHPDIARVPTADKLHHTVDCTHCLGTRGDGGELVEYDHEFVEDADGAECACGVRESRVSFDKNADDASGEMEASELVNEALPYDIPACAFSRPGHTFAGWNTAADGSGEAYADRATIAAVGRASTTLYAQWRAHRYSVVFDANSGDATGSMAEQAFTYGADQVALARNAFSRKGHAFTGWNTKADGSGTAYADGAKVADLTSEDGATVTLYAQWRANDYKVAFDKNAGDATGTMAEQGLTYDGAATALTECAFSRTGYDFAGWNTVAAPSEAEPGEAFSDKAEVRNLTAEDKATVVLYAQWAAHGYKVAFDKNAEGATGTMAEQILAYGAEQALSKNAFSRTGYTFVGWNTLAAPSEAEPGTPYADGQAVKNLAAEDGATVTLHAQWRANSYKVAFDKNAADATGTMAEQRLAYGADPVALAKNAFKRAGHSFAGWNTKADGTCDAYPDGARVADLTAEDGATVTLHAQWRANAYTVSFDPAGGSAVAAQKVTYGQKAKKPASPTKGAWTFGGWYSDAALKSAYDFSRPVTGNLTLHAKWSRTSIAKATMAKVADQAYTAKAITPKPAVKLGSKTLKAGTDFAYSYKANVKAGTATVTATGKGAYSGSVSRTFRIVAPAGSATATLLDGRRSTAALGKTCGTVGKSMTMTSLALSLAKPFPVKGGIEYRTHVQTTGWEKGWKRDGAVAGNPKQKKRLEGIQIRLYGDMAKTYDVYYRAHVQRVGWMAWAKDGASAGTQSGSRRMEAVQVVLVPKGAKAPANAGAATKAVFVDWSKQK